MTLDRAEAEDVLQDAYLAAAKDWERVRVMDNPVAWVRRAAINRSVDLGRRRGTRRRAYGLLQPQAVHREDVSLELLDVLSRLPVEERQVVVLHHLLDLTTEEIAREVGRPSGTVKAQLVRGRRRLAEALRLEEGVAP